jgi:serine/threonine protein kinase
LNAPLEQIFSKISAETVAAASLGQVYKATLRSTGKEVAIKVFSFPSNFYGKNSFLDHKHSIHFSLSF